MIKVSMRGFGITRLITLLIVLLFAPLTASATGSDAHASGHSAHGDVGDDCADHCPGIGERLASPAETPLHCHLKSPQAQAGGLIQAPVEGDLQLLAPNIISAPVRKAATRLPAILVRVPNAGPPRFILFGNFRS